MDYVSTFKHAGMTINIAHDTDCESPLDCDTGVHVTYRKGCRETLGNTPLDREEHESIAARIASGELIGLPVYAYVHSGVMLSTGAFSCPWDSGQSGFAYVDKATALEWNGNKIVTAKVRAATLKSLESVVSEFGKWLNGECYGYEVESPDGDCLDSCWGFIGDDYCIAEAKDVAEHCAKKLAEDKRIAWRAALTEARERKYWAMRDVQTVTL